MQSGKSKSKMKDNVKSYPFLDDQNKRTSRPMDSISSEANSIALIHSWNRNQIIQMFGEKIMKPDRTDV
jgi:hypothetical protein